MTSFIFSPSPFEIPHIKNAKLVKLEIKPFLHNIIYKYTKPLYTLENEPFENELYLKMNHILLKQFLLLENIWIHTSFILDTDLQLPLRNFHLFKLLFLNKKYPQLEHIEEQ